MATKETEQETAPVEGGEESENEEVRCYISLLIKCNIFVVLD